MSRFGYTVAALVSFFSLAAVPAQAGCLPPPSGLIGWWSGDGHTLDLAGTHDGALRNGATYAPGLVGQAFLLDGSSQYIDLGGWSAGSTWTWSAWVDPSSTPTGRHTIAGAANNCADWGITMQDGVFGVIIRQPGGCGQTISSGVTAVPGVWYHVVGTCDGATARIYVNGQFGGSGTVESGYSGTTSGTRIGGEVCCGSGYFPGLIDEVALFNRALAVDEVVALYGAGAAGMCNTTCRERFVSIAGVTEVAGRESILSISLNGVGTENALSFSLSFDPARLNYLGQTAGAGAIGTSLLVNTNQVSLGQLGLALAKPAGQTFAAGSNEMVRVRFKLSSSASTTAVSFADSPLPRQVVDSYANVLCANYTNATVAITPLFPPTILVNPLSQTVQPVTNIATNVTFSVTAGGSPPFTYQWRWNGASLPGASNASVTLTNVGPSQSGAYDVVVANDGGAITSQVAVLTVLPALIPPAIVANPRSQVVSTGETVYFTVGFAGSAPLSFQWQRNGSNIPQATDAALALPNITTSQAGDYRVSVSNLAGIVWSQPGTLTVSTNLRIVRAAAAAVATGGTVDVPVELVGFGDESAVGFSLSFDPALLTFQGLKLGTAAGGSSLLINSNSLSLGRVGVALARQAGSTFAVGTNQILVVRFLAGNGSGQTTLALGDNPIPCEVADLMGNPRPASFRDGTLTFLATAPSISRNPQDLTVPIFAQAVFQADIGGSLPLSFQWQRNGADLAGATDSILTLNNVTPSQAGDYRLIVSNAVNSATSGMARLTVARVLRAGTTNGPTGNLVELPIELLAAGDENSLGFSMNFDPAQMTVAGVVAGTGANGATLNFNAAVPGSVGVVIGQANNGVFSYGTQQVARIQFLLGQQTVTNAVAWSDQPVTRDLADTNANSLLMQFLPGTIGIQMMPPVLTRQPAAQTTWLGNNVTFDVGVSGSKPMAFQWQRNGGDLPGATNATFTITNVQSADAGNYSVRISNPAGTVSSSSALLTVLSARPDLFVSQVTAPATAVANQPVSVTWKLFNVGNADAPAGWSHTLWLASDSAGHGAQFVAALPYTTPLAAGQSLSVTGLVVTPLSLLGDRYFVVQADGSNTVAELDENNNTAVAPQPTRITSGDLTLSGLTAPGSAQFGQTITLTWSVANTGNTLAGGQWQDRVYLSSSANSLADAIPLVTAPAPVTLGPGTAYTNTQQVTLPTGGQMSAGTYYLTAVADCFNNVLELTRTNNSLSVPIALSFPPLPDLAVSAVVAPTTAVPGQPVSVAWCVTNLGSAAAASGGWSEAVYFSRLGGAAFSPSQPGTLITSFAFTNDLPVGGFLWRTQQVSLPSLAMAGDFFFVVQADSGHNLVERNTTNNIAICTNGTHVATMLSLSLPVTQIPENTANPNLTATVTRNGDRSQPLTVQLANTGPTHLSVPASVTIGVGQFSADFQVRVLDDLTITDSQLVTVTATASGYMSGTAQLTVLNTDQPHLTVTALANAINEGQTLLVTVTRDYVTTNALAVTLSSAGSSRFSAPASVQIPANAASSTFTVTTVDDGIVEATTLCTVTASAPGFLSGEVNIALNDVDSPQVTLTLASHAVSEKAGPQATTATVTRTPVSSTAVSLELFSSDTNAAQVPLHITIPANVASVDFFVAALDDGLVTSPRTNVIGGWVLASGTSTRVGTIVPDTLVINDADGASLQVTVAQDTVKEGLSPATTGTVTRNTPATNDLTVSLSSSDTNVVVVPASVVLPLNQASASFNVTTFVATNRGNQMVTLTASATGFADGTCRLMVTDTNLPDLAITSITAPTNATAQSYASISYHLVNQGYWPVTSNFFTRVFLATDRFGANSVLAGQFEFKGTLPVGQFFDQTLTVFTPRNVGDYWVIVQTDPEGNVPEVRKDNNTAVSAAPISVLAPYQAWVQADLHAALAGTPIPMHGVATNNAGAPAQYAQVNIHLLVRGSERIISAITDAAGHFSLNFQPLANEAGTYQIWAAAPGVSTGAVQDSFSLMGIAASPSSMSLQVTEGSSKTATVTLQNLSDVPLHGLAVTVTSSPADIGTAVQLSDTTLPGSGTVRLDCTFSAALGAAGGVVRMNVTTTEGGTVTVGFGVGVERLRPVLTAYPGSLTAGMARGGQATVGFDVVNTGTLASGPITVALPVVPWLQLATTNPMPALAPGQTNHVMLLLTPAADLQLGPYSGNLSLACDGAGLSVPFNFRCLSEAKGDLLVTAQDDYTYFASGAPNLAGATITVVDSYSQRVVTNGITDTNGLFFAAQLPEGYYQIQASAPGHSGFNSTMLLLSGQTNAVTAFLSRQTVQYVWTVVPTEIPDQTRITLTTIFDTAVPVPVITVDPAIIHMGDMTNAVNQVNLTIANHGLVSAQNAKLNLPVIPGFVLEPLITDLGTLPAQSTLVIPLIIRQQTGPNPMGFSPVTDALGSLIASWLCGGANIPIYFTSDSKPVPPPPPGPITVYVDPTVFGGNGFPGGSGGDGPTVLVNGPGNTTISPPTTCEQCVKDMLGAAENCAWSLLPIEGWYKCVFSVGKCVYGAATTRQLSITCAIGATVSCAKAAGVSIPIIGDALRLYGCISGVMSAAATCIKSIPMPMTLEAQNFSSQVPEAVARKLPALRALAERTDRLSTYLAVAKNLFGDEAWLTNATGTNLSAWLDSFSADIDPASDGGVHISAGERASLLAMPVPNGLAFTNLTQMLDRWNRTQDYYDAGIYNLADVPVGQSTDFLAMDILSNSVVAMTNAAALNEADGFDGPVAAVTAGYQDFYTQLTTSAQGGSGAVCAQVVLQLDQQAVMSREAFKATLKVINNSTSLLENVSVTVVARNGTGVDSTTLFGIASPTLENITAVDGHGVIPAGLTGIATWTLVPTVDAAPTNATVYYVSGTLSYTQDGILITVPLTGVPITVHPIPQLYIQYFLERDVFADDPFTPQTEPSVPFNLAVMVANRGQGAAHNFQITSAQPRIIDNQKGLLINFQIIGAQVNGQNLTPSLTVNFGDIPAGAIDIGRWLMISSLQGEFESYDATFQAMDDFGNKKTATVQDVAIHEMIHLVRAQGALDDGKPDFLVDDAPNARHLPDTIYLSNGATNPVTVLETSSVDSPPSAGHLQVELTAPMPAGWTYLLVPDPGNGQFILTRVVRSDGLEILLGTNAWTTDRTFIGLGRPPTKENMLHLLDYNSPGTYTLYYTPAPVPDTTAPVSTVAALSANSKPIFQVQWSGQDNATGSGIAFYDIYVSTNGGAFGPWLQQTRSTTALFQGALGDQYAFYCVATDQSGNREAAHTTPDAATAVTIANHAPALNPVPDQFVNAGDTLQLTLGATDPDGSADVPTFRLGADAPTGAAVNPQTGLLTWPTSRCAGASTNLFSAIVTDSGVPPLSATGFVRVVVVKSNTAPVLSPLSNVTINDGDLLSVTNTVTDPDCPANAIAFALGSGAPAGMAIDSATGILTWTPAAWQAPSTNRISVIATDNGVPPLSATQQFTVIVQHTLNDFGLRIGSTNLFAGETNFVPLVLDSGLGLTNLAFVLEPAKGRLTQFSLQGASAEITSSTIQSQSSNLWAVNLSLNPAPGLTGPRSLGRLTFVAVTNGHSAIVPVSISQPVGVGQGRTYTNPATANGLVIVVDTEPVLMAANPPQLTIYGHPGVNCGLQYRTNLMAGAPWTDWSQLVLTSRIVTVNSPLRPAPRTFYRAYEYSGAGVIIPGLSIQRLGGTVFGLTISGQPGLQVQLQNAANLSSPIYWSNLFDTTMTNSMQMFNWTNPGQQKQFFRAVPK